MVNLWDPFVTFHDISKSVLNVDSVFQMNSVVQNFCFSLKDLFQKVILIVVHSVKFFDTAWFIELLVTYSSHSSFYEIENQLGQVSVQLLLFSLDIFNLLFSKVFFFSVYEKQNTVMGITNITVG